MIDTSLIKWKESVSAGAALLGRFPVLAAVMESEPTYMRDRGFAHPVGIHARSRRCLSHRGAQIDLIEHSSAAWWRKVDADRASAVNQSIDRGAREFLPVASRTGEDRPNVDMSVQQVLWTSSSSWGLRSEGVGYANWSYKLFLASSERECTLSVGRISLFDRYLNIT